MSCGINHNTVQNGIVNDVKNRLLRSGEVDSDLNLLGKTEDIINDINKLYGEEIVSVSNGTLQINPSEKLIQEYLDTYDGDQRFKNVVAQVDAIPPDTQISPEQQGRVEKLLQDMGVKVDELSNILIDGKPIGGIEGVALPLQSLVGYVNGKTNTLSEEAFHIAVEILSQTHPGLLNKMMSQIASTDTYKEVYDKYAQDPNYQKDSHPDILKLKKEAIAKQLVKQMNQEASVKSWWDRVVEFFKGLFKKSSVNLSPFQETLDNLFNGNIGTVRDNLLKNKNYLMQNGVSSENADTVIQLANSDMSDENLRLHIAQITPTNAFFAKTDDLYNKLSNPSSIDGSTITRSSFDKIKQKLEKLFGSPSGKPFQEAFAKFSEQDKENAKKDINDILSRHINADGTVATTPKPFTKSNLSRADYNVLESIVTDKLKTFNNPKVLFNKDFFSDKMNLKSHADLVIIADDKVNLFNFFISNDDYISRDFANILKDQISDVRSIFQKQFNISAFGQVRAIPIQIEKGSVVVDPESDDFTEIPTIHDSVDSKKLSALISSLSNLLNRANKGASDNRLANQIFRAIRDLQVKGNTKQLAFAAESVKNRLSALMTEWSDKFETKDPSDFTSDEIVDFANRAAHLMEISRYFNKDVVDALKDAQKNNPTFFKDIADDIGSVKWQVGRIQSKLNDAQEMVNDFTARYVAEENNVIGMLDPERPVDFMTKFFKTQSQGQTKAVKVLANIINTINRQVDSLRYTFSKKLEGIKKQYTTAFGDNVKDILQPITQKDSEGKYVHRLISKYDFNKFTEDHQKAIKSNDVAWIKSAIDVAAYEKWFKKTQTKVFSEYENLIYSSDEDEQNKIVEERKEYWNSIFDISKNVSEKNPELRKYISDKYISEEYKKMATNKAALALHTTIYDINQKAYAAGAISFDVAQTFIPFVKKNITEKLQTGTNPFKGSTFMDTLFTSEELANMQTTDPETGKPLREVPFYFTVDLSIEKKDGTRDYSNVSQEIFKILPSYYEQVEKFARMKEQESRIKLLAQTERNKQSLAVNRFGSVNKDAPLNKSNETNTKQLEGFIDSLLYNVHDIEGSNFKIGTLNNKVIRALNKHLGTSIPLSKGESIVTASSVADATNKLFSLKALGLNIPVAFSNFIGGNSQAWVNQNHLFTAAELRANEWKFCLDSFGSEEKRMKSIGLMDYFGFFTDSHANGRLADKLAISKLNRKSLPEWIMSVHSLSELPVQGAIGMSMFQNTIVRDGQLVNVTEWVRNKPEYANRYDVSSTERETLNKRMQQEINDIKSKETLDKIAKFDKDYIEIPGVDRDSDTVYNFINRVQEVTRMATGGGNREEIRLINRTWYGRSGMVFKSWMPRLIFNRINKLSYNDRLQAYEFGRYNAVLDIMMKDVKSSISNLYHISKLTDKGVALLKDHYEYTKLQYENKTGQDFVMKSNDYIEMYQSLIKSSAKDAAALLILSTAFLAWAAVPPDDDDDKSTYNYVYNALSKVKDEMLLYYSPTEWVHIANGSLFPAAGVINDVFKLTNQATKKMRVVTNKYIIGDEATAEELDKKTHLFQTAIKMVPIANQSTAYMAALFPQVADDLGLDVKKTQKNH